MSVETVALVLNFAGAALLHEVFHHVADFLHQEGHGPFEQVHALRQVEWMNDVLVLFDVHLVVLDEDDGALVLVLAAVVWRAEDSDDRREGLVTTPSVHLVSIDLNLVRSDNRNEVVRSQNLLDWVEAELDGALTLRVGTEGLLPRVSVIHRVRPEQVAQEALKRWLNEPVDVVDVRLGVELWRNATVHAKVVPVDIGSDGHGFEALDEKLVDLLIVELLKDFRPESEMLRHRARLVVAAEHDDLAGIVELEAEEEDADFKRENTAIDVVAKEEQICPKHTQTDTR